MAKTDAPRGRSRRQSKRLNPEVVEEEDNASSEDQAKDDIKDTQKVIKDKADIEVAKGESNSTDTKLETADVPDDEAEIGPANVEAEDLEDAKTTVDDKPEAEDIETRCETSGHGEPLNMTPSDTPPEVPLQEKKEEIKDGDVEMDSVIEVKGGALTVCVSWKKDEQPEEPESVSVDLTRLEDTEVSKDEQVETLSTDIHEEEELKDGGDQEKTQTTEVVLVEESDEEPAEEKDDDIEIIEDEETEETEDKDDVEMEFSANKENVCEKNEEELEGDQEEEEEEDNEAAANDVEIEFSANKDVCEDTQEEGESDREEEEEEEDKEAAANDVEMDSVIEVKGGAPTVCVSWKKDEQPEEPESVAVDLTRLQDPEVSKANGKRKAEPSTDSAPSKKVKVINDGFCIYVGNLDSSKYSTDIRTALDNYFMTQSVMVQNIRLDKAKKHAFIDLVSKLDLTKALKLNGQKLLDKPLRIAKAMVKEVDLVKKKDPLEVQKSRNERCIHVENIPSSATKQDVLKVFSKAIAVRFLKGMENPSNGVAFVEFQSKEQADAALAQSGTVKIRDCILQVNVVRQNSGVQKKKSYSKSNNKDEAPPTNTLFVTNLPSKVQIKDLKNIFKDALHINIPQSDGKSRGYAFVEFESVALAQKALKASVNGEIKKRPFKVQFGLKSKTVQTQVPSNTLIVLGLHENTTAKTLAEAFEGSLSSRISVNKDTGQSKKFGFVEFDSVDSCAKAKKAAEDIEIDGRKVTVAFARPKHSQCPDATENEEHKRGKKGKGQGAGEPPLKKTKRAKQN